MNQSNQELVFNALSTLHQTMSLDKISISQLVRQAGVSRMYFYRHYETYSDILNQQILLLFSRFSRLVNKYHLSTPEEVGSMFFRVIQPSAKQLSVFLIGGELDFVQETFELCFAKLVRQHIIVPTKSDYYTTAFTVGGLTRLLVVWIQQNNRESPEAMGKVISNLIFHNI